MIAIRESGAVVSAMNGCRRFIASCQFLAHQRVAPENPAAISRGALEGDIVDVHRGVDDIDKAKLLRCPMEPIREQMTDAAPRGRIGLQDHRGWPAAFHPV